MSSSESEDSGYEELAYKAMDKLLPAGRFQPCLRNYADSKRVAEASKHVNSILRKSEVAKELEIDIIFKGNDFASE